jgi:[acyl-carrier-protein] S-malonyltransferase
MKTCFLYPGQGAQYPGMGKDLWGVSPKVKELFQLASEATSMDLEKLLFEGSEEELKATDNTQVAITLVNVAAGMVLKERGIEPEGLAGFSLGEYTALYEAGVIPLEDLFPIVQARGRLMQRASRSADEADGSAEGAGASGMAAVIGLSLEKSKEVLDKLKDDQVFLANYSSPTQVVLSGTGSGLKKAETLFKEAGARRYIFLRVSGPFHSPLLEEARVGLQEVLSGYTYSDPVKSVYANVTGKKVISGAEAKNNCVQQVVSTVLWVTEEESILADGFVRCLEVGPGSVLGGLWKSFSKEVPCLPAGTLEKIEALEG